MSHQILEKDFGVRIFCFLNLEATRGGFAVRGFSGSTFGQKKKKKVGLEADKEKEWKGMGDFPGGPMVKNPPCNSGDAGLIPVQGTKVPHAAGQLSPHTTARV